MSKAALYWNFAKPQIDLKWLEERVREYIDKKLAVSYEDENHIRIGEERLYIAQTEDSCEEHSGDREFSVATEFWYDPIHKVYALVGLVGRNKIEDLKT